MDKIETRWVPGVPIPNGYGDTYVPPIIIEKYKPAWKGRRYDDGKLRAIYEFLKTIHIADAATLAFELGFSQSTTHATIRKMLTQGLVESAGFSANNKWTKTRLYRVVE